MNQSIKLQEKEIIKKNIPSIIYQTQCKYCQVTSFQSLYLESDSTTSKYLGDFLHLHCFTQTNNTDVRDAGENILGQYRRISAAMAK